MYKERHSTSIVHCQGPAADFGASGLCANQSLLLKLEATEQNVHLGQVCRNVSQTQSGGAGGPYVCEGLGKYTDIPLAFNYKA